MSVCLLFSMQLKLKSYQYAFVKELNSKFVGGKLYNVEKKKLFKIWNNFWKNQQCQAYYKTLVIKTIVKRTGKQIDGTDRQLSNILISK